MNDNGNPRDEAVEKELAGVPEEMLEGEAGEDGSFEDSLDLLRGDLEKAQQEMQSGYMIKDRLLRPAMVAVAKKPG